MTAVSYKSTTYACYIGNFIQATVVNLSPILFIPLREQFGFSFTQLGALVLINFVTQVLVDLLFSGAVDRFGFRPFVVAANVIATIGFLIYACVPFLPIDPYIGFVIATIIFSGAGGLLELLLSPIVNAIPTDEKATAMSILHSFYCWGQVTVVLVTTIFLYLFGKASWQIITLIWCVIPVCNAFFFTKVPLAPSIPDADRMKVWDIVRNPFFLVAFLSILFGGAAEIGLSQWISTFMEAGLSIPKIVGDTAGMCAFAVMMGIGRAVYGVYGQKLDLKKIMLMGAALSFVCYLIVSVSPIPILNLVAASVCGLGVSLLWPGTLSLTAEKFPMAGAWMFAILAAGGDIGAAISPSFIGIVSDHVLSFEIAQNIMNSLQLTPVEFGLRIAILFAAIFPLGSVLTLTWMKKHV